MAHIKILEGDHFFTDSPNTGEPECICSRCHRQIKEGEKLIRVVTHEEGFMAVDADGVQRKVVTDIVNGREFRLCVDCANKAISE